MYDTSLVNSTSGSRNFWENLEHREKKSSQIEVTICPVLIFASGTALHKEKKFLEISSSTYGEETLFLDGCSDRHSRMIQFKNTLKEN